MSHSFIRTLFKSHNIFLLYCFLSFPLISSVTFAKEPSQLITHDESLFSSSTEPYSFAYGQQTSENLPSATSSTSILVSEKNPTTINLASDDLLSSPTEGNVLPTYSSSNISSNTNTNSNPNEDIFSAEKLANLHLDDVIQIALERNHSVIAARAQIDVANAQVSQARSIAGTKLTGRFNQTRLDGVGSANIAGRTIKMGKEDIQKAYIELAHPLFLGGKDRATIATARLGRTAAQAGNILTCQQVIRQVTMAWLGWLFAREVEKVAQKDFELAQAHYKLVSARLAQDLASKFELLRAEVRLAQARSKLRQEHNSVDLARTELLRVLALPPECSIDTQDRLTKEEFTPDLAKDASAAIDLREDLRIKRLELQIARQNLRAARAEKQPTLNAFGQAGNEDPSSKSGLGGPVRKGYWNAGLALEFPLVDAGLRQSRIKEAQTKLKIAENAWQEAVEKAQIEIRQALLNLQTAQEVVLAQKEALKQAEEALRLAGVKYENGMFTQVELFDAENAYLNTNLQYLQAVYAHHQAKIAYLLATGRLGRDRLESLKH